MDQLTPVQTRRFPKPKSTSNPSPSDSTAQQPHQQQTPSSPTATPAQHLNPSTALAALTSQPQPDDLLHVLRWLLAHQNSTTTTTTTTANKSTTQLIYTLTNTIIPHHYSTANPETRSLLVRNLRCVAGLGALVARLRGLLTFSSDPHSSLARDAAGFGARGTVQGRGWNEERARALREVLSVLEGVLAGEEGVLEGLWRGCRGGEGGGTRGMLLWKEMVGLVAGGKVLSVAGEAEGVVGEVQGGRGRGSWVAEGERYVGWLGGEVWVMVGRGRRDGDEHAGEGEGKEEDEEMRIAAAGQVLTKGLKLGFAGEAKDAMVQAVFADLIAGKKEAIAGSRSLLDSLAAYEQKTVLYALIRIMDHQYLSPTIGRGDEINSGSLGSVALLLSSMIADMPSRKDIIIEWLTALSPEAARQSHSAHRAVMLALSKDTMSIKTTLPKALELFADKLFIKHTPIFQQEINAQIVLLLVGYLHRTDANELERFSKSSLYLNAISNHLASTSPRSRFLGMVVGTAVSDLVDTKDKRMNFSSEDMEGSDGQWYRGLTNLEDSLRPIESLLSISKSKVQTTPEKNTLTTPSTGVKQPKPKAPMKGGSKIISIDEVVDESSEEDDLPIYAKPHSDPEDSDEDPELVQRSKPTAPVYIRDLLTELRDLENYDKHRLALSTAPSLIRRKANFGTEVTDNIEDLATLLVGLNDKYEMDSFQRCRLQGMIAILIADPERMGPWFARALYNGEYSMSQRASILTTLGLGAREIAGFGKEDEAMTRSDSSSEAQFASKRLPERLHNHYASLPSPSTPRPSLPAAPSPIETLSTDLSKTMLQPLAAQAADDLTGPTALKVRTFSSRLSVQSRTAPPTSNPLAKILASAIFFPLVGRWSIQVQTHHSSENAATPTTSPFLLSHLLRTLALIVHAGGATSPHLREITAELWDLLLSVRARATELPVLEALLFALLTLLEVNLAAGGGDEGGRRIAEEQARELLETQAWVEGLFERIGSGRSEEDEKVRMLAAGVLVRCREVVERYQRLLMGDLVAYM